VFGKNILLGDGRSGDTRKEVNKFKIRNKSMDPGGGKNPIGDWGSRNVLFIGPLQNP